MDTVEIDRNAWRDAIWSSDLPTAHRIVALCFADHSAPDGTDVWVAPARGTNRTGLARTAWHGGRRALVAAGWLLETCAATPTHSPRYCLTVPGGVSARDTPPCQDTTHPGVAPQHQAPAEPQPEPPLWFKRVADDWYLTDTEDCLTTYELADLLERHHPTALDAAFTSTVRATDYIDTDAGTYAAHVAALNLLEAE